MLVSFREILNDEVDLNLFHSTGMFGAKEIDGRTIMDVDNDESICDKVMRVIYPQMAKNQGNQWIYVVNGVEHTQAVVTEICRYLTPMFSN